MKGKAASRKATRPGGTELTFNGQAIEISSADRPSVQLRGRGIFANNPGLAAAIDRLMPGEWFVVPGSGAMEKAERSKLIAAVKNFCKKNARDVSCGVVHGGVMVFHNKAKGRA